MCSTGSRCTAVPAPPGRVRLGDVDPRGRVHVPGGTVRRAPSALPQRSRPPRLAGSRTRLDRRGHRGRPIDHPRSRRRRWSSPCWRTPMGDDRRGAPAVRMRCARRRRCPCRRVRHRGGRGAQVVALRSPLGRDPPEKFRSVYPQVVPRKWMSGRWRDYISTAGTRGRSRRLNALSVRSTAHREIFGPTRGDHD